MKLWWAGAVSVLLLVAGIVTGAGADLRLVNAVKKADKAAIRTLLNQKLDVNAAEPDGSTALHWAVQADDSQTVEMLVRAGADVKIANRYGITALHLACASGNASIVEMLLKAGADANTSLPNGETVLMAAARTGRVDAVKALLAHDAKVNAKENSYSQTALMWAAAEGNTDVVRVLLQHGADFRPRSTGLGGFTALLFAVREGRIGAAKALVQAGADMKEPLQVRKGDRLDGEMIQMARRGGRGGAAAPAGPQPLEPSPDAFLLAVHNAHYELALALVELGYDPNAAPLGFTALHLLPAVRKIGIGNGEFSLPRGSGNVSSLEFAKELVARGANINVRATARSMPNFLSIPGGFGTPGGRGNTIEATPFYIAARTADAPLMRVLAKLGADPLLPNADGTTPVLAAAGVGAGSSGEDVGTEPEMIEALKVALELGGDINSVDKSGNTVMHGVAGKFSTFGVGGDALVHFLVENGAKIEVWNKPNSNGLTPLAYSSSNNFGDSPTQAALRALMKAAGVSTDLPRTGGRGRGRAGIPPSDGAVPAQPTPPPTQ